MSEHVEAWHAEDAVTYLRSHPDAGVIRDPEHGWWVTSRINDERHPVAFHILESEGARVRDHGALERLDPSPHPEREIWVLRRMP